MTNTRSSNRSFVAGLVVVAALFAASAVHAAVPFHSLPITATKLTASKLASDLIKDGYTLAGPANTPAGSHQVVYAATCYPSHTVADEFGCITVGNEGTGRSMTVARISGHWGFYTD